MADCVSSNIDADDAEGIEQRRLATFGVTCIIRDDGTFKLYCLNVDITLDNRTHLPKNLAINLKIYQTLLYMIRNFVAFPNAIEHVVH